MGTSKISQVLLHRLPSYLNYLKSLPGGDHYISATTIANALGLGDVQVRKDLAAISDAGRRRTGRSRDQLIRDIEDYLGFSAAASTVVIGAGTMGQAFLDYRGFDHSGLRILACFDHNPGLRQSLLGKPIYPMEEAQNACDRLLGCGIRGIWNLSPAHIRVPSHVALRSENFAASASALLAEMKD